MRLHGNPELPGVAIARDDRVSVNQRTSSRHHFASSSILLRHLIITSSRLCVIPRVAEGPRIFLSVGLRTPNHSVSEVNVRRASANPISKYNSASQAPSGVRNLDTAKDPGSVGYARDDTKTAHKRDDTKMKQRNAARILALHSPRRVSSENEDQSVPMVPMVAEGRREPLHPDHHNRRHPR